MTQNFEKYDKFIWRTNGTLILLACIGAVLICISVGFKLLSDAFADRNAHDIVNIDKNTKKEEFLRLGYFQPLKGTGLILIPLLSERSYDGSIYPKSSQGGARNYLIFNSKSKESFWVWKSNAFLVIEDTKIHNQIADEKNQQARGLVFNFVEKDSNTDGMIDEKDMKSLQYFDLASNKSVLVIGQIDRSIGVQQTSNDEVLFFYSRSGKSYFKGLTISTLGLSEEKEIGLAL